MPYHQTEQLEDIHIGEELLLITPERLKEAHPLSETNRHFINEARTIVANIIHKKDKRLLVVCGPCSIHDIAAAKDYAIKLKQLADKLQDRLYIVMRVYFEKPRTTVGWKGLINDPHLDGSFDIEHGLHTARQLLIDLTEIGLPLATEALDPISPQYIGDLFSWSAIGARTTESQTHREMASGLSMPIGFKNGTDGNIGMAINALQSAASPHRFMGISNNGQVALLRTKGNPDGHLILRGGTHTNYDPISVLDCEQALIASGMTPALMIDCSHANSKKDYRRQAVVVESVINQLKHGNQSIIGIMLESNLCEGNQSSEQPFSEMAYGVSITDACIGWETTEQLLTELYNELSDLDINYQHPNE